MFVFIRFVEICVIGLLSYIVLAHLFGLPSAVLFVISFFKKIFFRALQTGDSFCSDSEVTCGVGEWAFIQFSVLSISEI